MELSSTSRQCHCTHPQRDQRMRIPPRSLHPGARPVQEQVDSCSQTGSDWHRLAQTGTSWHPLPAKVIAHGAGYHLWFCAGPMSHWLPTGSGDWRTPTRGMSMQPDMALSC